MKCFCIATLFALAWVSSVNAADKDKHLFILSGQSNMARLDPNISFTPAVEKAFGKENVTVVKDAQGGQPIHRWYKKWEPAQGDAPATTGDLYDRLMKKIDVAVKENKFATVTFIWMQGERDAKEKHGDVYAASLKGLLAQLEDDLKRKDINFVIGRLSDAGNANNKSDWGVVRKAQVEVAEAYARGAWVDTDDLNGEKNDLHYTVDGYKKLSERFAEKSIELIKKNAK